MATLREIRKGRRLSLADLALMTGYSEAMLSRAETGERRLSGIARLSIIRALGLTDDEARQVPELASERLDVARSGVELQ